MLWREVGQNRSEGVLLGSTRGSETRSVGRKILYLTGGIATGKSTVAKMFGEFGAKVIDADGIVHALMEEDDEMRAEIIRAFGEGVVEGRTINRKKLASIVFEDKRKLRILEEIVHPRVLKKIAEEIYRATEKLVVVEIPLLFERSMNVHPSVLVYCPRHVQAERLKQRDGFSDYEIERRLSCQIDIEEKRKMADCVIDNSGSLEETKNQVRFLLDFILSET